jgi:hypothetical protein
MRFRTPHPATRVVALGSLVALPLSLLVLTDPATAAPAPRPAFGVMTPATTVAARSDRRPMAGGLYDPVARKTFISWGGVNEDNYLQEYDHRSGSWSAPVKVGDGDHDSHNYPTMVQANNGHLLVFRGMHNVELVVSESTAAHTSGGTWSTRVIAEGVAASYPMPFKTANGDIYVFYRRTDYTVDKTAPVDQRPMLYVKSRDNGKTWSNSTQLTGAPFAVGSTGRADHLDEIYFGQMRYEPARFGRSERMHIVWTLAGGGPEGHLHDRYHRNIHYAYFTPRDGHFHAANGTDLGVQIDNTELEGVTKIVDTPVQLPSGIKSPDYIQQVGWRPDGRPFVVWFEADAQAVFHVRSAVWGGRAWKVTELAAGPGLRVREIEPAGWDTWRVFTTVDLKPGVQTALLRGGDRYRLGELIPTAKPVQRIELIEHAREPARLLATGASSAREVEVADGDIYVLGAARC